ncbi:alpha/beta hydrolase [Microbacterium gubbeenense]|uniref:alpha/beta hydrolase n=1 Tax=Microbacteriaceae TaxID=85023 RepID=UPI003F94C2D4
MVKATLRDHGTRIAARTMSRAPQAVVRRLQGRPHIVDGQELDPMTHVALRMLNGGPAATFERFPLDKAREFIEVDAWTFAGRNRGLSRDHISIPTRDGSVRAHVYSPRRSALTTPPGVLVYFHGGGWVVGSLDTADSVCATIAKTTGLVVVSVDYRLAPENPFPCGIDDSVDAFRWVRDHASSFGSDARHVAVGGESAGGNISAVVSLDTRDDPEGGPAFQLLFMPVTDLSGKSNSYLLFGEGYFLTEAQMDWYADHYLSGGGSPTDPRVSPLLANDLAGVAPAYVAVSGFDPLRDEGLAYANRLQQAGVPVETVVHSGQIHGFVNACLVSSAARDAVVGAGRAVLKGLQGVAAPVAALGEPR